ncbi:LexA family protein [Streptomyces sp. NPDC101209]|uniref:LexA family protein n=1 Tax=Streptomyces sp. NPDC101209 TaxID=3366129 RepID=UPI003811CB7C
MREIGRPVKLARSSAVAHHFVALEGWGVLYRDPHAARACHVPSVWVLDAKVPAEVNLVEVPLGGGTAAGAPLLVDDIGEDVSTLPRHMIGGHSGVFALTVSATR